MTDHTAVVAAGVNNSSARARSWPALTRRAVGWAEPVRRVMTSLQPPLLRQPDEVATAAWQPGFLYLKSVSAGARCVLVQVLHGLHAGGSRSLVDTTAWGLGRHVPSSTQASFCAAALRRHASPRLAVHTRLCRHSIMAAQWQVRSLETVWSCSGLFRAWMQPVLQAVGRLGIAGLLLGPLSLT